MDPQPSPDPLEATRCSGQAWSSELLGHQPSQAGFLNLATKG